MHYDIFRSIARLQTVQWGGERLQRLLSNATSKTAKFRPTFTGEIAEDGKRGRNFADTHPVSIRQTPLRTQRLRGRFHRRHPPPPLSGGNAAPFEKRSQPRRAASSRHVQFVRARFEELSRATCFSRKIRLLASFPILRIQR